jgi:DNA-binding response OmpR family regulator
VPPECGDRRREPPVTADVTAGEAIFDRIGCSVCHTSTITTAPPGTKINGDAFTVPAALGNKIIHPYSDFLLHDIGSGDGIPVLPTAEYASTTTQMRTAPLWALRTRNRLMHDGQSFTAQEAIARHGGQAASVTASYNALSNAQKLQLSQFLETPIIIVTGRADEVDRLLGLELGADDYICKPSSLREVVARVKAVLQRTRGWERQAAAARLVVDDATFEATLDGRRLDLTPVEFRLLKALAEQPGRIFERDQLLEKLYADHRIAADRTVDSHVKNLRRKLSDVCPDEDLIRSIYGMG